MTTDVVGLFGLFGTLSNDFLSLIKKDFSSKESKIVANRHRLHERLGM